jgi:hypothetical protein
VTTAKSAAALVCDDLGPFQQNLVYERECAHNLGHGVMTLLGNDLPRALSACNTFDDSSNQRECHRGVFMENAMQGRASHPNQRSFPRYLDPGHPLYPCISVETQYKAPCYEFQTIYALHRAGNDFGTVFRLGRRVSAPFTPYWYKGLGLSAATHASSQFGGATAQMRYASLLCQLGQNVEARSACVLGAVRGMIAYYRSRIRADSLCSVVGIELRQECVSEAREYAVSLVGDVG